jgi:hypothetical protein
MRIAIMQPYFLPYAGYFRLFAAADLFVVYDCVQFPRRGWVHRNRVRDMHGALQWLTLPLQKAAREVRIDALAFAPERAGEWAAELKHFPCFNTPQLHDTGLLPHLHTLHDSPVDYLERLLQKTCETLALPCSMRRSSTLHIPEHIRGQERILAICEALGASEYINSPGGKELYTTEIFDTKGVKLLFLKDYQGSFDSIIQSLAHAPKNAIKQDILSQCTPQ